MTNRFEAPGPSRPTKAIRMPSGDHTASVFCPGGWGSGLAEVPFTPTDQIRGLGNPGSSGVRSHRVNKMGWAGETAPRCEDDWTSARVATPIPAPATINAKTAVATG